MNIFSLSLIENGLNALWGWPNSGSSYEEAHLSPGNRSEPTKRRFAYLRNRVIRYRLVHLGSGGIRAIPVATSVSLRLHKDDLPEARSLMREVRD